MGTRLGGKVAIVTGGASGIGEATCRLFVRENVRGLVIADVNEAQGKALAAELTGAASDVVFQLLDVSKEAQWIQAIQAVLGRYGRLDILVNNAGRGMRFVSERFMSEPTRFWETSAETWRMVIATNVNGPFFMARAVVPAMLARGWGRIINVSMNHATMRRRGFSPYGPSKAALESETIIWAQELAGTGVTVNALLPGGATRTGMVPESIPEDIRRTLLEPEVVVPPLLWLASAAADGVTGQRLDASRWDPELSEAAAAAKAMEAAGWVIPA